MIWTPLLTPALRFAAVLLAGLLLAAGCGRREAPPAAETSLEARLDATLAGAHRTAEERARDKFRRPKETLLFFGLAPGMTVVEIWPGGGWYTNVIAPFLSETGGVYYAVQFDAGAGDEAAAAVAAYTDRYVGSTVHGDVRVTSIAEGLAPAGSADLVVTFRNVHNWLPAGEAGAVFAAAYVALKPGGRFGVVDHRADEAGAEDAARTGYVKESTVKALAEKAGFDFVAASEINANPKDAKDHPFGVWTLPPTRRSSTAPGVVDEGFDRARYDAIGESDRMTLLFRKPGGAPAAATP